MKNTKLNIVILLIVTLIFNACGKKKRFEIDTTKNRIEVKIQRFDSALISIDTTNNNFMSQLKEKFPQFLPIYTSEILNIEPTDTTTIRKLFSHFLADSTYSKVNTKTMETFKNVSDLEIKISDAFTYIHYYFPKVKLPKVYFFVSGFNRSVLLNENFIGVGTDFYLGSDYPLYKKLTYKYLTNNMKRESVASDLVSATLFRMFPMNSAKDRLLDNMLFRGKIMYLQSQFMPEEKPENLMGYSTEQWRWSKKNEKAIWASIIDHKDLFSTNMLTIRNYMNEAPFTSTVSQESPGRLGTWIGWQIVENYMNNNKNVGLQDLMNENNYQKILEKSGYRP